jgi:hypothetical protein
VSPASTAFTFAQVAASSPIAGMGSRYALRIQRNADVTATGFTYFAQDNESSMAYHCQGKKITLSYFARKGANYSATSDLFSLGVVGGKGIDQNLLNGYTSGAFLVNTNATLTTSWQRFSFTTGVVASDITQISLQGGRVSTGTAGANDYVDITGVQLEVGDEATDFEYSSYPEDLALCQRYFTKINDTMSFAGFANNANAQFGVPLATPLRVSPSALLTAGNKTVYRHNGSQDATTTAVSVAQFEVDRAQIQLQVAGFSGNTDGYGLTFHTGQGYLTLDSEI